MNTTNLADAIAYAYAAQASGDPVTMSEAITDLCQHAAGEAMQTDALSSEISQLRQKHADATARARISAESRERAERIRADGMIRAAQLRASIPLAQSQARADMARHASASAPDVQLIAGICLLTVVALCIGIVWLFGKLPI